MWCFPCASDQGIQFLHPEEHPAFKAVNVDVGWEVLLKLNCRVCSGASHRGQSKVWNRGYPKSEQIPYKIASESFLSDKKYLKSE